jgi:hypothetical protein
MLGLVPRHDRHQPPAELVWSVDGFYSPEECAAAIASSEAAGFEEALITTGRGMVMNKDVRNNDRRIFDDPALAAALFERLRPTVPEFARLDLFEAPVHHDEDLLAGIVELVLPHPEAAKGPRHVRSVCREDVVEGQPPVDLAQLASCRRSHIPWFPLEPKVLKKRAAGADSASEPRGPPLRMGVSAPTELSFWKSPPRFPMGALPPNPAEGFVRVDLSTLSQRSYITSLRSTYFCPRVTSRPSWRMA